MRHQLAFTVCISLCFSASAAQANNPLPNCSSNPLQVSFPNSSQPLLTVPLPTVRLSVGETQTITVSGAPYATPTPSPAPTVLGTLTQATTILGQSQPQGATIMIRPPRPSEASNQPANPISTPLPQTAVILDTRVAAIPSAVPTTLPVAGGVVPSTTYTIKGTAPGNTELYVTQGSQRGSDFQCAVVGLAVRSKDRFTATTGLGMSNIPKNVFTTVTVPVPDAASLPTPNPPPGVYVYKTESSSTQISVPILASYRINDAPKIDVYATFGYFASSDTNGPVFGISVGSGQLLVTLGQHSGLFTDYSPYVNPMNHRLEVNGAATFAALPTTISTRKRQIFVSVTVPASLITSIFPGGSNAASGNK
jgi:hypothetical protein